MSSKFTFLLFVGLLYYESCCNLFTFVDSIELNHLVKPDGILINREETDDGSNVRRQDRKISIRDGKSKDIKEISFRLQCS